MCSKGDPFPCVVLEAMHAQLPIICFEGTGGYCEIVKNDFNGQILPFGNITECSKTILNYSKNTKLRETLGENGKRLIEDQYTYSSYVNDLSKFALSLPIPKNLSNVLTNKKETNTPYVIFAIEDYWISGVNTVIINTIRGLIQLGYDTHVVVTQKIPKEHVNDIPFDIPYKLLPLENNEEVHRKYVLKEHLKNYSPCVFLPHTDYLASSLSKDIFEDPKIKTIGVLHADDEEHYDHGYLEGRYWDHIVCVSNLIRQNIIKINPVFKNKTTTILNGIEIPEYCSDDLLRKFEIIDPIKIIYTGRIIQFQKRILDFIQIVKLLKQENISFHLTIVGDGPEFNELKQLLRSDIDSGLVTLTGKISRKEIFKLLKEQHIFALISDFEGLPMSLLEAMSHYCIPIVSNIQSGIQDILTDKMNSLIFPIGNYIEFVNMVKIILNDQKNNKKLAKLAFKTLKEKKLTLNKMSSEYSKIIKSL